MRAERRREPARARNHDRSLGKLRNLRSSGLKRGVEGGRTLWNDSSDADLRRGVGGGGSSGEFQLTQPEPRPRSRVIMQIIAARRRAAEWDCAAVTVAGTRCKAASGRLGDVHRLDSERKEGSQEREKQ
eukprot:971898-Rhodomonas_salina.2